MIVDTLKNRWHQLPINRQLIVLVNAILLGFVVVFLAVDYRMRKDRGLIERQLVLASEAKTLYEGLHVVEHHGDAALQDFIDNVGKGMSADESSRHYIAADWNGKTYESLSHKSSAESTSVISCATLESGANESIAEGNEVIGTFKGPWGTVHVSENRVSVLRDTHFSLLSQTLGVLALGAIAAFVTNVVLRQLVAKPIEGFASALRCVASGDLSIIAQTRSSQELIYLAEEINDMTRSLEHAQRDHRLHMDKAREIQQNLRPSLTELTWVDIAVLFEPADDVGGDYYDVIRLSGDRILLCVADVAGHGVPAAMAATLLKAFVSEAAKRAVSPARILTEVNQRYCEYVMMGYFATMCLVVVDNANQCLTYAIAGHEYPILQMGSAKPMRLEVSDLPLGVEEGTVYSEETIKVRGSARLVIISDGVSESFNPFDEQFGTERIEKAMLEHRTNSATEVVGELRALLESFRAGCKPFDDTTLLVAQFVGSCCLPERDEPLIDNHHQNQGSIVHANLR